MEQVIKRMRLKLSGLKCREGKSAREIEEKDDSKNEVFLVLFPASERRGICKRCLPCQHGVTALEPGRQHTVVKSS